MSSVQSTAKLAALSFRSLCLCQGSFAYAIFALLAGTAVATIPVPVQDSQTAAESLFFCLSSVSLLHVVGLGTRDQFSLALGKHGPKSPLLLEWIDFFSLSILFAFFSLLNGLIALGSAYVVISGEKSLSDVLTDSKLRGLLLSTIVLSLPILAVSLLFRRLVPSVVVMGLALFLALGVDELHFALPSGFPQAVKELDERNFGSLALRCFGQSCVFTGLASLAKSFLRH